MYRLRMVGLCLMCFGYALLRGRATKKGSGSPQKVAVVQRAKLGDMVCTTPLFAALRKAYPSVEIYVIGDALNRELLEGHPDVHEYIVWRSSVFGMARELRRRGITHVCITGPQTEALAVAYLAGVPLIVVPRVEGGVSPYETLAYRCLRFLAVQVPHHMGQYAPREYLLLLEPFGVSSEDTTKHLRYSDTAQKQVESFLQIHQLEGKKFAVLSPSAGNKIKNWPADRFARVAEYIVSRGLSVVVIGSARDKEEVTAFMHAVEKSQHVIDASEKFSIDELKAFIARSALFVSGDTGPIYIAEAFGVSTVDIVGPMDEREQPPRGPKHLVVVAPRTVPMLHIMNARIYDAVEARRQVEAISVSMVIAAVETLLPER